MMSVYQWSFNSSQHVITYITFSITVELSLYFEGKAIWLPVLIFLPPCDLTPLWRHLIIFMHFGARSSDDLIRFTVRSADLRGKRRQRETRVCLFIESHWTAETSLDSYVYKSIGRFLHQKQSELNTVGSMVQLSNNICSHWYCGKYFWSENIINSWWQ